MCSLVHVCAWPTGRRGQGKSGTCAARPRSMRRRAFRRQSVARHAHACHTRVSHAEGLVPRSGVMQRHRACVDVSGRARKRRAAQCCMQLVKARSLCVAWHDAAAQCTYKPLVDSIVGAPQSSPRRARKNCHDTRQNSTSAAHFCVSQNMLHAHTSNLAEQTWTAAGH